MSVEEKKKDEAMKKIWGRKAVRGKWSHPSPDGNLATISCCSLLSFLLLFLYVLGCSFFEQDIQDMSPSLLCWITVKYWSVIFSLHLKTRCSISNSAAVTQTKVQMEMQQRNLTSTICGKTEWHAEMNIAGQPQRKILKKNQFLKVDQHFL